VRAFYLQVMNSGYSKFLKDKYINQITKEVVVNGERGKIIDSRGEYLAMSLKTDSIYANPSMIEDKYYTAKILANLLGLNHSEVLKKLKSSKKFVWIDRKVSKNVSDKIRSLKIKGISFIEEYKRHYPYGVLASNLLGFCNVDEKGIEGLEYSYENFLKSKSEKIAIYKDASQHSTTVLNREIYKKSSGGDIKLTIDSNMQSIIEKEVKMWVDKYNAKKAAAVVIEPDSGRVLSMVSYPTFNPNSYKEFSKINYKNLPVSYNFEPGSTIKPVIASWVSDKKLLNLTRVYYCGDGYMKYKTIEVHDAHKFKSLNVGQIVIHSSNIGMVKIASEVGPENIYKMLRDFGFGELTNINISGENVGILPEASKFSPVTHVTMAFGQGIAVTPLQMVVAYAAIINGGYLLKPYIVDEITNNEGEIIKKYGKEVKRKVLTDNSSKIFKNILTDAVNIGTGRKAKISYISVGGKTGTAQIPKKDGSGYESSEYISSFIGFFPSDDPKCLMFMMIERPKGQYYASEVVCPIFKKVSEEIMPFFDINSNDKKSVAASPVLKPKVATGKQGDGVPDLYGLTKVEVLALLKDKKLKNLKFIGSGFVEKQSLKPGENINSNDNLVVYFSNSEKKSESQ